MQLEWAATAVLQCCKWRSIRRVALEKRSEVMASGGMVTTSQPWAAEAGMRILRQGGNAIDAVVATAALLNATEPMDIGVGGNLFFSSSTAREITSWTYPQPANPSGSPRERDARS
jgi:gamma-glutamyltranspeptidase